MADFSIIKVIPANMLPSASDGEVYERIARFLQPTARSPEQAAPVPYRHLLAEPIYRNPSESPAEIEFKGWKRPQKKWKQWVSLMLPRHGTTWKKAGIFNAIKASLCEINRDLSTILGLVESWCQETNTFVFEWGEATLTLQDVLVLGGFSALGESVSAPLTKDLKEIERRMVEEQRGFSRQKAKKASHGAWITHYMGSEEELEHVAFLSLWVSRYVLPAHPFGSIGQYVFSIAARLAEGIRIALGPAVLASLYRDLGLLKRNMGSEEALDNVVWAPFQLLQTWAWERFPLLRPIARPKSLCNDEPMACRWDQLKSTLELQFVRNVLKTQKDFQWRPYEAMIMWTDGEDEGLHCLARCMGASELVGLRCSEHYHPHRVARQFGLDQDLPARCSLHTIERNFNKNYKEIRNFVQGHLVGSEVSLRYSEWWKQTVSDHRAAIDGMLKRPLSLDEVERVGICVEPVPPGFSPMTGKRSLEEEWDDDNLTLSERLKLKKQGSRPSRSMLVGKNEGEKASLPQNKRARDENKREQNEEAPYILLEDEESPQEENVCVVSDVEETTVEADTVRTGFYADSPIEVDI